MILEKLKEILADLNFDIENITLDTSVDDIELYAYDLVEVVMAIESEFNIKISDDQLYEFNTIGDIIKCISNASGIIIE